jgi:hypothetical protein
MLSHNDQFDLQKMRERLNLEMDFMEKSLDNEEQFLHAVDSFNNTLRDYRKRLTNIHERTVYGLNI